MDCSKCFTEIMFNVVGHEIGFISVECVPVPFRSVERVSHHRSQLTDNVTSGQTRPSADRPGTEPHSHYDQSISFDDDNHPMTSPRPRPLEWPPELGLLGNLCPAGAHSNLLSNFDMGHSVDSPPPSADGAGLGYNPGFSPFDVSSSGGRFLPGPWGSSELAQLFSLITKFQPPPLELSPHSRPFLPALVPSIGAIDAFIKVPRPDGDPDLLGLTVLDEPTIGYSNPQILRMQLREKFGVFVNNDSDGYIGCIRELQKNPKALTSFLDSYDEISRNRAAPTMNYTYKVPDLRDLMQQWPEEMEGAFASLPLRTADMDPTFDEYVRVICATLDILVKGNVVESLHVLFSLFHLFTDFGHFAGANSRRSNAKPDYTICCFQIK
jgi:intraflagellar transport protein 46